MQLTLLHIYAERIANFGASTGDLGNQHLLGYGMTYGNDADITLSCLTVPRTVAITETETSSGISTNAAAANATLKAGEPFEIHFLAENAGGDGSAVAEIYDNGNLIASEFVAVNGSSFRVITMSIVLDVGTHELSLNGITQTVVVE